MTRPLPHYPIYIPTKGRWDVSKTAATLARDHVPFYLVVEAPEYGQYAAVVGQDHVLTLPFANLGLGSIPARNWIRDHAEASGAARHWQLDDNIRAFYRFWHGERLYCDAGIALRVMEDFADRYENVGIIGPNYKMFAAPDAVVSPFRLNAHVYSCVLISHAMPYRWRGRYNEDTDLCLQALAGGWCTVQVQVFLCDKLRTMVMKGGNTETLYQGDGRLRMARSLERLWPGVVTTTRRFQRPQHSVADAWKRFDVPLRRRTDIDWSAFPAVDEYGASLVVHGEPKGEDLTLALSTYAAAFPQTNEQHRGVP